jgi:hypothetical protein
MAGGVVVATARAEIEASVDSTTSGGKEADSLDSTWYWEGDASSFDSVDETGESPGLVSVGEAASLFCSTSNGVSMVSTGSLTCPSPPDPKTSLQRELMTGRWVRRAMREGQRVARSCFGQSRFACLCVAHFRV